MGGEISLDLDIMNQKEIKNIAPQYKKMSLWYNSMCYLEHKRYGTLRAFLFHRIRMSLFLPLRISNSIFPLIHLFVCSIPDCKYVGKDISRPTTK